VKLHEIKAAKPETDTQQIKRHAAEMLGVNPAEVQIIYYGNSKWNTLNILCDEDEGDAKAGKSNTFHVEYEKNDVDGNETMTLFTKDDFKFIKGEWNDYGGGDDPHYIVIKGTKLPKAPKNNDID